MFQARIPIISWDIYVYIYIFFLCVNKILFLSNQQKMVVGVSSIGPPSKRPFPISCGFVPVDLGPSGGPVEVPMGKVNCFEPMARSGDADDRVGRDV